MKGRRRQRVWSELIENPQTPYMIGRLLGANEMAVALLAQEDNETAKIVSTALDRIIGYFMVEETDGKAPIARITP